jgi:acylglycerol lipase
MIRMAAVLTTLLPAQPARGLSRRTLLAGLSAVPALLPAACGLPSSTPPAPIDPSLAETPHRFVMADGTVLPVRTWWPAGPPRAIILALHGFNDSRDAWEIPAPPFTAAGYAIVAPDQRGFGATPTRGFWAGQMLMVQDAQAMLAQLRAWHPGLPLVLMGESMGGAIALLTAAAPGPRPMDATVLLAPAVWARAQVGPVLGAALWLAATVTPGLYVTGQEVKLKIVASDNRAALLALVRDPLTLRRTRFDTLLGLARLMDAAQKAAPGVRGPVLSLYGEQDKVVPEAAMRATWEAYPDSVRRGLYPRGYHLLLRDLGRAQPIADVIAWLGQPGRLLPSGAEATAAAWLQVPA